MRQREKKKVDDRKAAVRTEKQDRKERRAAKKKDRQQAAINQKAARKKEREKKRREQGYILRKNAFMKGLRVILWIMLGFVFLKGVIVSLQPTATTEARILINNFKSEFAEYKDDNEEILSFAENFAKEYLTYAEKGENDYKNRLQPYVGQNVLNISEINDFKGNAAATYVNAYRKEEYGNNQYDVYVLAEVEYQKQTLNPGQENTFITEFSHGQAILKVPVLSRDDKYVVEDIPMFVSDSLRLESYGGAEYYGTNVPEVTTNAIRESLTSFLTAYYTQDQNVIEYYLSKNADKSKFSGLKGRFILEKIEELKCYKEEGQKHYTCIVKFKVKDSINGALIYQELNVKVINEEDKYYVQDINTKINNIKNN